MPRTVRPEPPVVNYRLVCWENLIEAPTRRYGPVTLTSQLLDQFLELTGEKHPIHRSDRFARSVAQERRVVPSGLIQSFTSGWVVQHSPAAAVVALQSATWEFARPLHPDEPFYFTNTTVCFSEIDDRRGLVTTERRVFDANEQDYATGRMEVVMLRRKDRGLRLVAVSAP